jgi:ABC-type multidrug transport system fused ATPase/permease subunit
MFISSCFELISIGSLIPFLGLIVDENFYLNNIYVNYFLNNIYYLDKNNFIFFCLSILGLSYSFRFLTILIVNKIKNDFTYFMQKEISQKLLNKYFFKNYSFFFKENVSTLVNNIDKEAHYFVVGILSPIMHLIIEFFTIILILSFLFYYEPFGAFLIFLIISFFSFFYIKINSNKITTLGTERKKNENYINKVLIEAFSAIKDIKLVQGEKFFIRKFKDSISNLSSILAKQKNLEEFSRPVFEYIGFLSFLLFIIYAFLTDKKLSELVIIIGIFMASSFRLLPSGNRIVTSIQSIRFYKLTLDLVYNQINHSIEVQHEEKETQNRYYFKNLIEICNLSFFYNKNKIILKKINLQIKKGEFIGIFGESGSGKTTFVDLLSGFLEPCNGKILCDGKRIDDDYGNWRKLIGYVPQSIYLIDDTIKNNICFGVEEHLLDVDLLNSSIYQAQLSDFIEQLPNGIETAVGDRGISLSLGQIQRIGIARALYMQKPILIFDESTNSLDSENTKQILSTIKSLKKIRTIIFISHNVDLLKNCDKIFKLHNKDLNLINN